MTHRTPGRARSAHVLRGAIAEACASRHVCAAIATAITIIPTPAFAHVIARGDRGYVMCTEGLRLVPFVYLGAKHMVTGYDHLLFLVGVIFFLYRLREIALYVTLFALGHSITLLGGVIGHVAVNPYLIDGIIGMSVAYKGLDNIGVLEQWLRFQPSIKMSTMFFGLCHGLGLASKMQDFDVQGEGVISNLLAFNVGVEVGQLLALGAILIAMNYWRRASSFVRFATAANYTLVAAGIALIALQLNAYVTGA